MGRPEDKRDTERIEILGELKGEVTVFQPMAIREISRGGALIETGFPLQLDSLHEFRLTLGDRSVVVKGRVAHCSIIRRAARARRGGGPRIHRSDSDRPARAVGRAATAPLF